MNPPFPKYLNHRTSSKHVPSLSLILAMGVLSLLPELAAAQTIPALPEISPATAAAHPELVSQRAALVAERNALRQRTEAFNVACQKVKDKTVEDSNCRADSAALARDTNNHISASKKFIDSYFALQVFDSRTLITGTARNQAVRDLARLRDLERKLVTKLEEVRGWKGDINRHAREFEQMRADARRDLISELFDHLPVPEGLNLLVDKKMLDPNLRNRIQIGFQVIKAALNSHDAAGGSSAEQANKIVDANRAIRNALVASVSNRLDEKTKKWLDGLSQAFDAMAKLAIGASVDNQEQALKAVLSALEVLYPPGGILILGERIGERLMMNWAANRSLESLGDALASTWNAELYLQQKLDDVRGKIKEVERLVDSGRSGLNSPPD